MKPDCKPTRRAVPLALAAIIFLHACALLLPVGPASATSEEILPVWREIFARPADDLASLPAPAGNSLTPAKIQLGRKLFHDTRLSGNMRRSCATCHEEPRAFTDGRIRAAAIDGKTELANTPTLLDLAWSKRFFWDGRAQSLEAQASFPILHPQEMAGSWPQIMERFESDPAIRAAFAKAFPENPRPTRDNILAALASFERTLISPRSRFDEFISGQNDKLSQIEMRGFVLFVGKAGCVSCHNGWRFTDDHLHRTSRSAKPIKTPTLRGLSHTAPYMHDGALNSIGEVITHYEGLDPHDRTLSPSLTRPLKLNAQETKALIAFIGTLN